MRSSWFGRTIPRVAIASALASAVLISVAPTAFASTKVKLGQTKQSYTCSPDYEWIQTAASNASYVVPAGGGKLKSWQTRAGAAAGTMQFEVWKPDGGDNFRLVYISQPTVLTAGKTKTVRLVPKVKVAAGDLIGYRSVTAVNCALDTGSASDTYVYNTSGTVPTKGSTVAFQGGVSGFEFDIAATLVG